MSRVRTESTGDSLCPVCHENAEIFAIGPCDHPICYRCSTRMRVLCDQTYCPICRGELPQIVHLTSRQKYDSVARRNCIPNRKYKILFEDESVEDGFQALLEHRCQTCDSRPLFNNFKGLQVHINRTHKLFACDLCVDHLKIFPFERKFYNRSDLATHRRVGDPDNRSYRGHPLCGFCDVRYMDNDELFRHLRKSHYFCHICDSSSSSNEYFDDYPHLKDHFKKKHFVCEEGQCGQPETRFTNAFATDIDFKAHVAAEHMGNKSKLQARELRTIDVGFHVAPRRRGRDAGIIAPEDFEEVNDFNRGPRDHRQRRYNNQHEASSRSDNMTPPPTTEASGPPVPQPPAIDDFPVLGNCPQPFVPTAAQKPAEAVEDFPSLPSNAQSKSTATTTSSLVPPSTRPGKSSVSAASQKQPANFSTVASIITSSGPGQPSGARNTPLEAKRPTQATTVTKQSWGAPRLASGEDFPSLGGGKKDKAVKDGPNYVTLGAWTKVQKSEKSRPPSNKSKRESPSVRPVSSLASLGRSLCDDGEFPSLGGSNAPKQATWIQKNAKPAKKKAEKSTPLGNCLAMPSLSKEKTAQVNGAPEKKADQTESKKKKKKQKEKQTEASTEDSGISLSSIASEIDSLTGTSEQTSTVKDVSSELNSCPGVSSNDQTDGVDRISEQKFTGKESSSEFEICPDTSTSNQTASAASVDNRASDENGGWETVTSKKAVAFHEDDFPSLCPSSKRSNGKWTSSKAVSAETTSNKKNKSLVTTTTKTFQDDFPSFSSISERTLTSSMEQNTSEKKSKKKSGWQPPPKSLREDDFPELSAPTKKTNPPPGFHKAQVAAPPPGLGTQPSSESRAPPGLTSVSISQASTALVASNIPLSVKLCFNPFAVPDQEKQRNNALVTRVRELLILKVAGFDRFCALSRDFRSGQLSAQEYHKTCQELFGEQKFLEILPELVALLPDILKQHELAEAHNLSILGICAPLNLTTCPTCHQYLKVEDSAAHRSSHVNQGQNPPCL